jgi:hypothetical protein
MPKAHKPGSQGSQKKDEKKPTVPQVAETKKQEAALPTQSTEITGKGKPGGKGQKPQVGGTAAQGAKSTQPKQISSSDPQKQQAESYNRQMRRRMQHMGTGPYTEPPPSLSDRKKKRLERKKKQQEEVKKIAAKGPRKITLGRRNTYFLIGVAALIVLTIVLALIINHPFK